MQKKTQEELTQSIQLADENYLLWKLWNSCYLQVLVLTQQIQVRKRKLLKINVGLLLFKQSCTYMPVKYFIWYVIVAGWQETFRSAASRLAGDFWVCASPKSLLPAGRRPRLKQNNEDAQESHNHSTYN